MTPRSTVCVRHLALLCSLFALGLGQGAQAQAAAAPAPGAAPCLTQDELGGLVTFALPVVLDSAIQACRPDLSPKGWFARHGAGLVRGYAARKGSAWPAARAALVKLGSTDRAMKETLARLPDSALQPFAEGLVTQMVGDGISAGQCPVLERAASLLAPLPPSSTAELVSVIITLADQPKPGKPSRLPVCRNGK